MTEYVKTVDPNGSADYTSLNLWEDGEDALYSSGDVAIADCRRTGATKDTTAVTISGWTAGVIPKIIVNPLYRHDGKWPGADGNTLNSQGNYVAMHYSGSEYAANLTSGIANLCIDGLCFIGKSEADTRGGGISFNGAGMVVENCLFHNFQGVSSRAAIYTDYAGAGCIIRNCAFDNLTAYAINVDMNVSIHNCTAYDTRGFRIRENRTPAPIIRNCVSLAPKDTYACFSAASGSWGTGSDNNVSSDATAPGTTVAHNKTAYTDYFVDPSNGDFHLKGSSQSLWGISGQNLSALFTTDIDGQTRVAWDIGADEYVASGSNSYTLDAALGSFSLTGIAAGLLAARKLASDTGSFALTGQSATLKAARKIGADGGTFALSGLAAGLRTARKIGADVGAFSLAGQDLNLLYGRRIAADAGAFTLTGVDASLLYGRKLSADAGAFTFAGEDATLIYTPAGAYVLTADGAVFALSGNAAGLLYGRKVSADSGVFSLSGQDAGLKAARRVSADSGAFQFNGQDATLVYTPVGSYILTADGGVYALAGNDVALRATRRISADPGAFTYSGQAASLLKGYRLATDSVGYVLTGEAAELLRAYLLEAGYGVFAVTGADARLEWSGLLLPKIIRATITGRGPRATITGRGPHATIRGV